MQSWLELSQKGGMVQWCLVACCGRRRAESLLHSEWTTTAQNMTKIIPLTDAFRAYCAGKPNKTVVRYTFNTQKQQTQNMDASVYKRSCATGCKLYAGTAWVAIKRQNGPVLYIVACCGRQHTEVLPHSEWATTAQSKTKIIPLMETFHVYRAGKNWTQQSFITSLTPQPANRKQGRIYT